MSLSAMASAASPNVDLKTGQRVSRGGQKLHTVEYWPANSRPRAVVMFHHGLVEHCQRYSGVGNAYAEAGIAFVSYDIYNHGKSESQDAKDRGYLDNWDQLVDDLSDYTAEVRQRLADEGKPEDTPFFLQGQSMGGLVSAYAALREQQQWSGLILNSPLINVEWTPVLRVQAKLAGFLAWALGHSQIVPAVRVEDMSQDPEVVRGIEEDPLMVHGDIKARTSYTLLQAFRAFEPRYCEFSLPVLAIMGDTDKCTSLPALKTYMDAIASSDKTLDVIQGGYHELLMGPEKEEVLKKLLAWIDQHAPSARL